MRITRIIACLTLWAAPWSASAAPSTVVVLEDPRGDDHGPGTYQYPTDTILYPRGSFDLVSLEVAVEGNEAIFTVVFDQKIVRPFVAKRTNATQIIFENGLYVQNVDIYLDTIPGRGVGFVETVPGRNVTIDPDHAWDVAVVLTPQPYATRSLISDWKPTRKVVFASNVTSIGPKVVARVDVLELGGRPQKTWGYQAMVTGAKWEPTFDLVNRFVQDRGLNAFTMMVQTVPEPDAFGGGRLDYLHPFVVDMLAPSGTAQERILAGYDPDTRRLAEVPLVYPDPSAHQAALAKPVLKLEISPEPADDRWMALTVKDVQDDMIILARSGEPLEPYRLGDVLDEEGQVKCRAVVTSVHDEFVVATAVKCGEKVRRGDRVRFDASGAKD